MVNLFLDIETTGLNPYLDRIVAVGYRMKGVSEVVTDESEENMLRKFNADIMLAEIPTKDVLLVTFNGDSFDLPFMYTRGFKNGVNTTYLAGIRHVDLMWVQKKYLVCRWKDVYSMKNMSEFFGVTTDDILSGKDVPLLWEKGDIEKIVEHCKSDLQLLEDTYKKLKRICDFDIEKRYGGRKYVVGVEEDKRRK